MILSVLIYMATAWASLPAGPDILTGKPSAPEPGAKGSVVIFLSAKCPCSSSHVEELKKMAGEYPDFRFVGVHSSSFESKEQAQTYFTSVKMNFPVIRDNGAKIADRFRASKTPHAFVLSPSGETVYKGGVTDSKDCDKSGRNFLRDALEDIRAGKKVRTAETRSLGCAIGRGGKYDW